MPGGKTDRLTLPARPRDNSAVVIWVPDNNAGQATFVPAIPRHGMTARTCLPGRGRSSSGRVPGRDREPSMEVSLPTTVLFEVYIDPDRCGLSCVCIDMWSMGVFVKNDGVVYPYNSHLCCSCFKCNEFCPHHAISTRWIVRA